MPIYTYSAKKGPTEIVTGEIEAPSEGIAVTRLEEMGMIPVKVSEKGGPNASVILRPPQAAEGSKNEILRRFAPQNDKRRGTKVRSRDLDTFTRQLASLVKSSIQMLSALALLAQQTENKDLKEVILDLGAKVKDGKMLSEAMTAYPRIFNNMYLSMIKSGERSGTLDQVLFRLADHREREQELKQRIQAALAYPVLIMIVGAGTIFVMLTYFLPKLTVIFKGMKQDLPLPTKMLMGLTAFMSAYWYVFLIAAALVFIVFSRIRKGGKRKMIFDAIKMRLPLIRKFTRDAEIARFARSLSVLLKNGLPIHESLELAADTLDNDALKAAIYRAGRGIIDEGLSLSGSFVKVNIFPAFTLNMISVGEESGRVVDALEEIATVYEREVDQSIKIMSSLMEPLLILVVGAIVGFIVFAMLMPVFNMGVMGR